MTFILLLSSLLSPAEAARPEVTWTGIDYGMVTMVASSDFRDPSAIFPGYLQKWNALAVAEQLNHIEKRAKVKLINSDLSALETAHASASGEHNINRNDGLPFRAPYLSPDDVQARVASYSPYLQQGTGLVFVADHLHKLGQVGCYHIVFYDLSTRQVEQAEFQCGAARGFGFRNYWFGTFKNSVKGMSRYKP